MSNTSISTNMSSKRKAKINIGHNGVGGGIQIVGPTKRGSMYTHPHVAKSPNSKCHTSVLMEYICDHCGGSYRGHHNDCEHKAFYQAYAHAVRYAYIFLKQRHEESNGEWTDPEHLVFIDPIHTRRMMSIDANLLVTQADDWTVLEPMVKSDGMGGSYDVGYFFEKYLMPLQEMVGEDNVYLKREDGKTIETVFDIDDRQGQSYFFTDAKKEKMEKGRKELVLKYKGKGAKYLLNCTKNAGRKQRSSMSGKTPSDDPLVG